MRTVFLTARLPSPLVRVGKLWSAASPSLFDLELLVCVLPVQSNRWTIPTFFFFFWIISTLSHVVSTLYKQHTHSYKEHPSDNFLLIFFLFEQLISRDSD